MLRAGADMGKAQFAKQSGYPALGIDDAKARLDHPLQVDPPPADNPVHRRIGAGLDNLAKFFHLDIAQVARPARALAVGEAIRSLFVEPVNPVPQGLAIHPTDPCGLSTAHAIVDRRKRQQTAALPGILATAGEFTKVAGIKVATKRNTGWHGDPPLPTLNQIKTDLGIPTESEIDAVGMTHVGDSQAVRSLTQCGEPMRFAMAAPIDLRNDFDSVSLRRLAKRTRDATQSRRLLALAEVYDGGSRTDASRIGGVGLQIIRDWVLRFNARGPDGLVDGKSPGAPSKLNADHRRALAEVVEAGPVPAVDGVVRWRRKDLARWLLETFAISLDETTVGRELKALGFAKISARPRHYAQNELAVEAFKKNFPAELAKIRARLPKGVEIELWWQDEARIGQKNKLTRRWARRGTRPRAPRDQRTEWAYIFGAICPAKGKGTGLVMPWCDTDAMAAHLIEISAAVDPGTHAVLIVDQAGWHLTPKLAIPDNITVLALPPRSPELNPVENVWQFMRDNWLSNRIFKSYEDIVALCCQAWNNLIDQPWKIMSLGMCKWAHGF